MYMCSRSSRGQAVKVQSNKTAHQVIRSELGGLTAVGGGWQSLVDLADGIKSCLYLTNKSLGHWAAANPCVDSSWQQLA